MDVVELIPGLHLLRFPVGHAYLWQDPDGLTLVDTGVPGSWTPIADAINGLGLHPADLRRLVLTHSHADHVGTAAEVVAHTDAIVLAHRADAPVIRGDAPGPAPDLADWERPLFEQISAHLPAAPPAPVRVDTELDDGDIPGFADGARTIAVPGHTPGSVALYLCGPRVLFTGDAMARRPDGRVIPGVFNVDPPQALASFRRLAALDVKVACFGHGDPLTHNAPAELRAAASHLPP
jgi:glyoxylase-like metal-dependent hydrolase (beta-lactamase superfamily II)